MPFWAKIRLGQFLLPTVYHAEIPTFFETKLPDGTLYCEIKVAWVGGLLAKKDFTEAVILIELDKFSE